MIESPVDALGREIVSVFESCRSYAGFIFRVEDHIARLAASARTVGLPMPSSGPEIERILYKALADSRRKEAFLRVTLSGEGLSVLVTRRSWPREVYAKGVRLRTATVRKSLTHALYPEAKTSNYGGQVLATLEMPPDIFDVVFIGGDGCVKECRTSNIFLVKDGVLMTPPAAAILEGVTRRVVLEIAPQCGVPARETSLTRHDFYNAGEVFLTNTSGEIIPVREIDGRKIGSGVPGAWTRRLHKKFKQAVRDYINPKTRVLGL
jgi:branched-chain amino acid aminotransferase